MLIRRKLQKDHNEDVLPNHRNTYYLLGSVILLAILALIATYFVKRKSESKNEKTRKIFTIILFIVLLSGCEADNSNKKKDKAESKGIRIVPTTVALTMTLDKLDLPIVGKPTSYKSYQIDIKMFQKSANRWNQV